MSGWSDNQSVHNNEWMVRPVYITVSGWSDDHSAHNSEGMVGPPHALNISVKAWICMHVHIVVNIIHNSEGCVKSDHGVMERREFEHAEHLPFTVTPIRCL